MGTRQAPAPHAPAARKAAITGRVMISNWGAVTVTVTLSPGRGGLGARLGVWTTETFTVAGSTPGTSAKLRAAAVTSATLRPTDAWRAPSRALELTTIQPFRTRP